MTSYYESKLGSITINIPYLSAAEKLTVENGLGTSGKFIIEEDFTNRLDDFRTNEILRDHLDETINAEESTLYLDSNEERLKIWTTSFHGILRTAVYLNTLLDYSVSTEDMEDFRRENKVFSSKKYREFETKEENVECTYLMAGILDFSIWISNGQPDKFIVCEDLLELFSDYPTHADIEKSLVKKLSKTPFFSEIQWESESGYFFAQTGNKEALVEIVVGLNEMVDVYYTEEDKELLIDSIDVMLSSRK